MAVREFTDHTGREWRAWDVVPDDLSARTKDETYLAQLYVTGWVVFETKDGGDKRRLHPVPKGWSELPDADVERLLDKAEIVPQRKSSPGNAAPDAAPAKETVRAVDVESRGESDGRGTETYDVTDLGVLRTFRYPTGRFWAVCVIHHPEDGGSPVLRFTAGARNLDLRDWPKDWADYSDEDLINLLRHGAPRQSHEPPSPTTPHRRWDDTRRP